MHKDGSIRWVWERGIGVEGEGNFIEGFVSDITLRKQAEEKLAKSEQRIRSVIENMESGLALYELVYDQEGSATDCRFLEVNPAFERMTGLPADVAIGYTMREVMPEFEDGWVKSYIKVGQTGRSDNFIRYYASSGRTYKEFVYPTQKDQFAVIINNIGE
jgi:PAS domain S-box-containing protein